MSHAADATAMSPQTASPQAFAEAPLLRFMGEVDYLSAWQAMRQFTALRGKDTRDEIWLVKHLPVYTQGIAGKPEHLLRTSEIPVVKTDRGGQITYHGPGQIIAYLLLDLKRWNLNVRGLVNLMEQAVIDVLAQHGVTASGNPKAPGVYVGDAKIASLGLKIKNGCSYHGIAFNADMDLTPFEFINPCGFAGLRVTSARNLGIEAPVTELERALAEKLCALLKQRGPAIR